MSNDYLTQQFEAINTKLDLILKRLDKLEKNKTTSKKTTKKTVKKKEPVRKSGSVLITQYDDCLLITGDTFYKKQIIKGYGGKWNPENKGWTLHTKHMDNVKEELENVSKSLEVNSKNGHLLKVVEKKSDDFNIDKYTNSVSFISDSDSE